ncbi:MAG: TraR/DksA C4-type zinc finger protein [Moraxellaceae bacterium]|nr:TraR/DksA C4-type zinc finger protein [Moraxellaceae bacterium]
MNSDSDTALAKLQTMLGTVAGERRKVTDATAAAELEQAGEAPLSRMEVVQQQTMTNSSLTRLDLQQRKLEAAVNRISAGKYGICCRCGDDVEPERLQLDPATPFCSFCVKPEA